MALGHREHPDAARAGQPLAAGRDDGVGAGRHGQLPDGLGGVEPHGYAVGASERDHLGGRLHQAPVGGDGVEEQDVGSDRRPAASRARPGRALRRRRPAAGRPPGRGPRGARGSVPTPTPRRPRVRPGRAATRRPAPRARPSRSPRRPRPRARCRAAPPRRAGRRRAGHRPAPRRRTRRPPPPAGHAPRRPPGWPSTNAPRRRSRGGAGRSWVGTRPTRTRHVRSPGQPATAATEPGAGLDSAGPRLELVPAARDAPRPGLPVQPAGRSSPAEPVSRREQAFPRITSDSWLYAAYTKRLTRNSP